MVDNKLFQLVSMVRPGLLKLAGSEQAQAFANTAAVLYMLPLSIGVVGWLLFRTEWGVILGQLPLFTILLIVVVVMGQQSFSLDLRIERGKSIGLSGSLSSLVLWSAILTFGPGAIWLGIGEAVADAILRILRAYRLNQKQFWEVAVLFTQQLGSTASIIIAATAVYGGLGGTFPLTSVNPMGWLPALVALAVDAFLPGLLIVPLILYMNRLAGTGANNANIGSSLFGFLLFALFSNSFAILSPLLFVQSGLAVFLVFMLAIILVNTLAHYLSRTNRSSQQRSRELEHLEALGQAIIQSPAEATQLPDLLRLHVNRMFPRELVEIRLFENPAIPPFHLLFPANQPATTTETQWQQLAETAESYIYWHNVQLPQATTSLGDAVLVKITAANAAQTTLGGVYLLRPHTVGQTLDSLAAAQSLASQIASALYRAQVYAETIAHQKVTQELELAGRIQASFLPTAVPQFPGWEIAATLIPARQTSGDFYDFVALGNGRLGLLVADVADKGTGAALYMALSRTLLRTYAMQYPDQPAEVLRAANERILSDTQSDQFVTVFYGVLEVENGRFTYANAGHNPTHLHRATHQIEPLTKTGIPLGMFPDLHWTQKTAELAPGDTLVFYTDGISEAQDKGQAEFGEERLMAAVEQNGRSAQAIQTTVITAVQQFVGDAPQFDDMTLLVVTRNP